MWSILKIRCSFVYSFPHCWYALDPQAHIDNGRDNITNRLGTNVYRSFSGTRSYPLGPLPVSSKFTSDETMRLKTSVNSDTYVVFGRQPVRSDRHPQVYGCQLIPLPRLPIQIWLAIRIEVAKSVGKHFLCIPRFMVSSHDFNSGTSRTLHNCWRKLQYLEKLSANSHRKNDCSRIISELSLQLYKFPYYPTTNPSSLHPQKSSYISRIYSFSDGIFLKYNTPWLPK